MLLSSASGSGNPFVKSIYAFMPPLLHTQHNDEKRRVSFPARWQRLSTRVTTLRELCFINCCARCCMSSSLPRKEGEMGRHLSLSDALLEPAVCTCKWAAGSLIVGGVGYCH